MKKLSTFEFTVTDLKYFLSRDNNGSSHRICTDWRIKILQEVYGHDYYIEAEFGEICNWEYIIKHKLTPIRFKLPISFLYGAWMEANGNIQTQLKRRFKPQVELIEELSGFVGKDIAYLEDLDCLIGLAHHKNIPGETEADKHFNVLYLLYSKYGSK